MHPDRNAVVYIFLDLGYIQIGCVAIFSLRIIACDLRMRRKKINETHVFSRTVQIACVKTHAI